MTFSNIRLVLFDWAGTTVDFGSCAPTRAFQQLFASRGIDLSAAVARGPMGTNKRDHLVQLLQRDDLAAAWKQQHGRDWSEQDVDDLYDAFADFQLAAIAETTTLVPGLLETIEVLQQAGVTVGTTTGYFQQAADTVRRLAAQQGYRPSINVCADQVTAGRPAPWMIYRAMEQAGIYPAHQVLHLGDTVADIQSGVAAGCWSVGVCDSSNETGLSPDEWSPLDAAQRSERIAATEATFRRVGAHAVLPTISALPELLQQIDRQAAAAPTPIHSSR